MSCRSGPTPEVGQKCGPAFRQLYEISARHSSACSWDRPRPRPTVPPSARRLEVVPCSVRRCSPSPTTRRSAAWSPPTRVPPPRRSLRRGRRPRHRDRADPRAGRARPAGDRRPPRRGRHRSGRRRGHPRSRTSRCSTASTASAWRTPSRCRSSSRRSARPCRATATGSPSTTPPRSAPRPPERAPPSRSTWRTTPRSTPPSRSSRTCAASTRGSARCSSRRCAAPRPMPPTSHGRVRGCGWSRAPTPSRPRWRTPRRPRWTRPTCAACGSCLRVRATPWSPPTTRA